MKKNDCWLSLGYAAGVVVYVTLVAWLMNNAERIFGKMNGWLGVIAFLLLFTFSAAVVGALVLGKPLILFLHQEKKRAVWYLLAVLGWLLLALLIIFVVLALV